MSDDNDKIPPTLLVRALTEPILIMGVPREMTYSNGMLHIMFILITKNMPCAVLALITYTGIHIGMKAAAKKDPQCFDCFRRFIKHKKYYGV